MAKIVLKAVMQHMAKEEISNLIPADTMKRILAADPHPEFRAYCIGHEGEAKPTEVGYGTRVLKYFKDAIVQIADKVKLGTNFFHLHNKDNSTAGRESIGEVVGKTLKNVNDKLHAIAVAYIKPDFRALKLDVASFEGDMEYGREGESEDLRALNIDSVTGIALGDSRMAQPAFAGATLLAAVQHFTQEGGTVMTPEEIRKLCAEKGYTPEQIFAPETIVEAKVVKDAIYKGKQTEYEHAKRVETALAAERGSVLALTAEKESLTKKLGEVNKTVNSARVESLLSEASKSRTLSDQQKAFIDKHRTKFESTKEGDELKLELNKFLDDQLKEYTEYCKLLGIEPKKEGEEGSKAAGSADDKTTGAGAELTDPTKNEFIPKA